ncbi:SAM-dependent methyltransferase [Streptomyces apocyni]|uniref:SAM-dependent methyltransferase n=1 Tax=Streptomyces apocyni TaxID=2654677 RepID=UPI0012EA0209
MPPHSGTSNIDRVLDPAGVGPRTRMLEIGTRWGALAVRAGLRSAEVTTLTLSPRQRDLARSRIANTVAESHFDVRRSSQLDVICSAVAAALVTCSFADPRQNQGRQPVRS